MADNKMKKGFATYLLILLLVILAAFLIVIVIMLFSPFQNIIGFQYMTYNTDNDYQYRTTAGEELDFSTIDEINITCDKASVRVERAIQVQGDAIKFENYCKGFAYASDRTDFTYEIYFSDAEKSILNVEVHEPEGFLFFDDNMVISIIVPSTSEYALENTKVNISTDSGNVMIANQTALVSDVTVSALRNSISLNSFDIRSNRGNVYLYSYIDDTLDDVFIKTNSGTVSMQIDKYDITNSIEFHTISGNVRLNSINYTGEEANADNIVFDVENGAFNVESVTGNIKLNMDSGYLDINSLHGNLSSSDSVQQMESAEIRVNSMNGDLNLPFANNSTVSVNSLSKDNQVFIKGNGGNITIGEMDGYAHIETTSGNVNVTNYSNDMIVKTTSGNIDVKYDSNAIDSQLIFSSSSGRIDIGIRSGFKCIAEFLNTNGNRDNSKVDIQFQVDDFTNPQLINVNNEQDEGSIMTVTSDSDVTISLI